MTIRLDPEFVNSVVSHMNEDHADAVLAYVQAFGGKKWAVAAELIDLDPLGMKISYLDNNGDKELWLEFGSPVTGPDDIRQVLVRMARDARARLSGTGR